MTILKRIRLLVLIVMIGTLMGCTTAVHIQAPYNPQEQVIDEGPNHIRGLAFVSNRYTRAPYNDEIPEWDDDEIIYQEDVESLAELAESLHEEESLLEFLGEHLLDIEGEDYEVFSCNWIRLTKVTDYTKQRIRSVYGSEDGGYIDSNSPLAPIGGYQIKPDPNHFYESSPEQSCDYRGKFRFDNLEDGEYYLVSSIDATLEVSGEQNADNATRDFQGTWALRVDVSGGETKYLLIPDRGILRSKVGN